MTDIGIQRAQDRNRMEQDYMRMLLQMAAQLFVARPMPLGQTQTTTEPVRVGFGPISMAL